MNQTLRDKAWKVFEIAACTALVWFVVIDWKSFLAWLFDSGAIFAAAVIPLLLLAIVLLAIERND
jgi:hypothetical protein